MLQDTSATQKNTHPELMFSDINAPNLFDPKLTEVRSNVERVVKKEVQDLEQSSAVSATYSRSDLNEALHALKVAGRQYGLAHSRNWSSDEVGVFQEVVAAHPCLSSLTTEVNRSDQLEDSLERLFESYVDLGREQRREGDRIVSELYTVLRGIDVNFGELLAIIESVEPADRQAVILDAYKECHGVSFFDDVRAAYDNPVKKVTHWWGGRNTAHELNEIFCSLKGTVKGSISAAAYKLARAVPEKGKVDYELLRKVFRTLPSEWKPKVELKFCAIRGIEPETLEAYYTSRVKEKHREQIQALTGDQSGALARIDALFLASQLQAWRTNFGAIAATLGAMRKTHLKRVIAELDNLLTETSSKSFSNWLEKKRKFLHRDPTFDRVYYLYKATTTDGANDYYYKAEAARVNAALHRRTSEFVGGIFLEKDPADRRLVAEAYKSLYGDSILRACQKDKAGLSPVERTLLAHAIDPRKDDDKDLLKLNGIPVSLMLADVYDGLGTHEAGVFALLKSHTGNEIKHAINDYNSSLTYKFMQKFAVSIFSWIGKRLMGRESRERAQQDFQEPFQHPGGRNFLNDTIAELDGVDLTTALQLCYGKDRPHDQKIADLERLVKLVRSPKLSAYVDFYTREGKNLDRDLKILAQYEQRLGADQRLSQGQQEHFDFLEESTRTRLESYRQSAKNTAFQSANWMSIGVLTGAVYACASLGTGWIAGILITGTLTAAATFAARFGVSRLINGKAHGRESALWDLGLAVIDGYTLKIGFIARYLGPMARGVIGPMVLRMMNSPLGRRVTAGILKGGIKFVARKRILATLSSSENKESQYVNYLYKLQSEERRNRHRSQASKIAEQILMYG